MLCDLPLQHDNDRRQDIGSNDIVTLIARLVLNLFIVDDIALHNLETVR